MQSLPKNRGWMSKNKNRGSQKKILIEKASLKIMQLQSRKEWQCAENNNKKILSNFSTKWRKEVADYDEKQRFTQSQWVQSKKGCKKRRKK